MIEIKDVDRVGELIQPLHLALGMSQSAFARAVADATGRDIEAVRVQLSAWAGGRAKAQFRPVAEALKVLGLRLVIVSEEEKN
jgi:hypothetical protein